MDPRARPAREAGGLSAHDRPLRALQEPDRAADLTPVVVLDGGAQEAGVGSAALRPRALPPRLTAPVCHRLARERARLEHLPPALVGPPVAGLGVPRRAP